MTDLHWQKWHQNLSPDRRNAESAEKFTCYANPIDLLRARSILENEISPNIIGGYRPEDAVEVLKSR
jgi:hypothetical protein